MQKTTENKLCSFVSDCVEADNLMEIRGSDLFDMAIYRDTIVVRAQLSKSLKSVNLKAANCSLVPYYGDYLANNSPNEQRVSFRHVLM